MDYKSQALIAALNDNLDHADGPAVRASAQAMGNIKNNPNFVAQFDITLIKQYFTVNGGVYTPVDPSAIDNALKVNLAAFVFGTADYASGFQKLEQQFPVSVWTRNNPFVFGKDAGDGGLPDALDANAQAVLQKGDLVLPYSSPLPGGGTTTVALVIIRCEQIAYGTLLDELTSDTFNMNMIRYSISDETQINQYNQNVETFEQSIFGKTTTDKFSPNAYKTPEQQLVNFVDIPIEKGIDKHKALATFLLPTTTNVQWSIFVSFVNKLSS